MSAAPFELKASGPAVTEAPPRKRVLIAVDASNPSHRAVHVGGELAETLSAEVMLLHVVLPELAVAEMPRTQEVLDAIHRQEGAQVLDRARQSLPAGLHVEQRLVEGVPAEEIVDRAREWRADFVVMGTRRRGRLSHFLLGSTAEAVVRKAHCPVVTAGDEPAAAEPPAAAGPPALYEVLPAT